MAIPQQKLQAERGRGQKLRVKGSQWPEWEICPQSSPFGPRTVPEAGTELEVAGLGVPTGTPATASHPTESA